MKHYTPHPIDTDDVTLPEEVEAITEQLAKNTHENWSAQRMADGWKYGPVRLDLFKRHPCLIPYEALPEAEKEYDRRTAVQTLKLLLAMGFEITKRTP